MGTGLASRYPEEPGSLVKAACTRGFEALALLARTVSYCCWVSASGLFECTGARETCLKDDKAVTEVVFYKSPGGVYPGLAVTSGQSAMAAQVLLPQSGYVTSHKPSARPQCPALRVTYCFSTRVPLPMLQEPLELEIARVGAHWTSDVFCLQKEPSYRLKQAGDILGIQFSLLRGAEEPPTEWVPPFKK